MKPIFERMDLDRNVAIASAYSMKNLKGETASGVANVTLTEAKAFLEKCVTRLCALWRQPLVKSDVMEDKAVRKIENFLKAVDAENDMLLSRRGQKDKFSQLAEMVCLRGPIAMQILTRADGDKYIADRRVLDTRFFYYESGDDGVWWGAPTMTRSAMDIEREYGIVIKGSTAEVIDCWDENEEVVFIDGVEISKRPNPYGYAPFVTQIPACGLSIQEKDYVKYRGESIFSLLRNDAGESIFDEANFIASLLKTMSLDQIKPALVYRNREGELKVLDDYPGDPGSVIPTDVDSGFDLVPKRDIKNSTRIYKNIVDINKQLATYTILDFGSTTMPLSGTAMARLSENKDELLLNRLNAIAFLLRQEALMTISNSQRACLVIVKMRIKALINLAIYRVIIL